MRTLKTSFAKLIGLALLNCLTLTTFAQTDSGIEIEDFGARDDHKVRIYFSPLNLVNPAGNSLQLTAGKSVWKGGEIQANVAQRLGFGDPFLLDNFYNLGFASITGNYIRGKGTRVGLELQQSVYRSKFTDLYVGLETALSKDLIYVDHTTALLFLDNSVDRNIVRTSKIQNVKVGSKFFVAENFILDVYCGIGYISSEIEGTIKKRINLPWNVKLGYQF